MDADSLSVFAKYLPKSIMTWFLLALVIFILAAIFIGMFRYIKGTGKIDLVFIKFERNILTDELQGQIEDLSAINSGNAQIMKLLNQTIITYPKWCCSNDDELQHKIQLFYEFFLPGLITLYTRERDNGHRVAVFTEQESGYLKIFHGSGYSPEGTENLKLRINNSSAGYSYSSGEKYFNNDLTQDPRYKRNPLSSRQYYSLMCVPIQYSGTTIGILNIDGLKRGSFDRDDLDHLTYFASALAPLIKVELEYIERTMREAL
ncbi:MAG: GAF domain-containing protein [Sporolactobacillus sp.]